MAGEAYSSHRSSLLEADDMYFSVLQEIPISDEKFAEELQLQETILSSILSSVREKASSRKRLKGESSRSRTVSLCMICMDTKDATDMFTSNECSHSFCADCISKHIAAKLVDNLAVKCPEPKCKVALEPGMCSWFVPKQVMERWGDALFEAMVVGSKRLYCPFGDCSATMIDEGDEVVTSAECPSCSRLFCAQCKVGWHSDMECEEFQKLRKEEGGRDDVLMRQLANRRNWKKCPHCKIYVEKTVGCLHIFCRCGNEFCYSCESKWGGSHACPAFTAYEEENDLEDEEESDLEDEEESDSEYE